MNDSILRALMQLSALVAQINQSHFRKNAHSLIKTYLEQSTGRSNFRMHIKQYLTYYNEYTALHYIKGDSAELNKQKLAEICVSLTTELNISERFILILSFLELINLDKIVTSAEEEFLNILAKELKINQQDFSRAYDFIIHPHPENIYDPNYLVISNFDAESAEELEGSWILKNKPGKKSYHTLHNSNINGRIYILKFDQTDLLALKYLGNDIINLNKNTISQDKFYVFNTNDFFVINNSPPLHYYYINDTFKNENLSKRLVFTGKNVLFSTPGKLNLKPSPFSYSEESGNIICINSKSHITETILNNLSGRTRIKSGEISLNGYNLNKELYRLQKFIGLVTNEPIYSDFLSVSDNLYYSARQTYPQFTNEKIYEIVNETIKTCYLWDLRNEIPCKSDKIQYETIYQKLIQLAFILVKDPYILFVNNILNNLSASDTSLVFNILHGFSSKGKIVFIPAENLNSVILKNIDKIWIFDDYNMIYNGNTIELFTYFSNFQPNKLEPEIYCPQCNNVFPESISQIINQKIIDENGNLKSERKISADTWYSIYKENIETKLRFKDFKRILPLHNSIIPKINQQYQLFLRQISAIYYNRIKEHIKDLIIITILGVILAFLFRNDWTSGYKYGLNPNIHLYISFLVLVVFITGFINAEKEIKLNKKVHALEANINLNFISLINARCTLLFLTSLIYSLIFVVTGYFILQLTNSFYKYLFIYFSVACLGNLTGVLLSHIYTKRISVYTAFLIIVSFFTLFNGVTINSLHYPKAIRTEKFTPVISDLSPLRWAFEALVVDEAVNNEYENKFYEFDKRIERSIYFSSHFIPEIQKKLIQINSNLSDENNKKILVAIKNEIKNLPKNDPELFPFEFVNALIPERINDELINETIDYLRYAQIFFSDQIRTSTERKHRYEKQLGEKLGSNKLKELKLKCFNNFIFEMINYFKGKEGVKFQNGSIIKIFNPIYYSPESNFGRAPMFAPEKLFNGYYYNTFWFNLFIIWMFLILFYLVSIACCFKY